jgi:hypothetical protein
MRATMSLPPPAGQGTMILTGLLGKACAETSAAGAGHAPYAASAATMHEPIFDFTTFPFGGFSEVRALTQDLAYIMIVIQSCQDDPGEERGDALH